MCHATDISRSFAVIAFEAILLGAGGFFAQSDAADRSSTEKAIATPPNRTTTVATDGAVRRKNFVAPPPLPVGPADQAAYLEDFRRLLDVGFDLRSGSFETARQHFDANLARGEDPRLYYAWALVCLKRLKNDQALETLRAAVGDKRFFFPPAWQMFIRAEVAKYRFSAALQSQVELARVIEASSAEWPDEDAKNQCAGWNGRMTAYLQTAGTLPSALKENALKADADILAILSGPRRAAYENGKATLSETATTPSQDAPPGLADRRIPAKQRQAEQLAEQRDSLQDKKDKLTVDATKTKEGFAKKMTDLQTQLSQLETTYNNLGTQCQALATTISQDDQQRQQCKSEQVFYSKLSHDSDAVQKSIMLSQQIVQLTWTINNLRAQYTILANRAAQVKRQAAMLIVTRNQLAAEFQQGTQQMAETSKGLEEGEKRILAEAKTKEKTATSRTRSPARKPLNACFPLDFEVEKRRLLDVLPVSVEQDFTGSQDR
jgi:hypothetical protein